MKKLLLLLLFIPLVSFGQTFDEIMKMNSEDIFVRYMVENGFEIDLNNINKELIQYKLNPVLIGKNSSWDAMATFEKPGIFNIGFNLASSDSKIKYTKIYNQIKEKCTYGNSKNGTVTYYCKWKEDYQKMISVMNFNNIRMFSSSINTYYPNYKFVD
ncbi:hypothetical protein OAN56_02715 [Flavobacteriaceae bacterium]|nr:hypothetical protein [Flavobacteriaceae bacterium]